MNVSSQLQESWLFWINYWANSTKKEAIKYFFFHKWPLFSTFSKITVILDHTIIAELTGQRNSNWEKVKYKNSIKPTNILYFFSAQELVVSASILQLQIQLFSMIAILIHKWISKQWIELTELGKKDL